jgi:hypothetical protein
MFGLVVLEKVLVVVGALREKIEFEERSWCELKILVDDSLGPCFSFLVQFDGQIRYGVLFILLV